MNQSETEANHNAKGSLRILTRHSIIYGTFSAHKQGLIPTTNPLNDKLNTQFRYFRETFIALAAASGVPVPLGITEDIHARLFTFCRHDGPKYVLDTIATHIENSALVRCGLSLLIMTITILSHKLHPLTDSDPASNNHLIMQADNNNNNNNKFSQAHYQVHAKEKRKVLSESEWAAKALHHVCETGAVSAVINLLTGTVVLGIQEQCVNVLALLVAVSEDAAHHMLAPPHSILPVGNDKPATEAPPSDTGASSTRPSSRAKGSYRAPTMLETTLRNASASTHSFPMLAKRLGIHVDLDALEGKGGLGVGAAGKRPGAGGGGGGGHSKPPLGAGASGASQQVRSSAGSGSATRAASCLSHLLTVAAQQKNGHVLIAGCAECVANMCLRVAHLTETDPLHPLHPSHQPASEDLQHKHLFDGAGSKQQQQQQMQMHQHDSRSPLSAALECFDEAVCLAMAQTRTTLQPARGATSGNDKKAKLGYKEGSDKDKDGKDETQQQQQQPQQPVVAWACLRIFFRFLARNFRYRGDNAALGHHHHHQTHTAHPSRPEGGADMAEHKEKRPSRLSDQQREAFSYAYEKVLLALSRMILGSPEVCRQVLLLKGAEDLLRQSTKGLADPSLRHITQRAVDSLRVEKRALRLRSKNGGAELARNRANTASMQSRGITNTLDGTPLPTAIDAACSPSAGHAGHASAADVAGYKSVAMSSISHVNDGIGIGFDASQGCVFAGDCGGLDLGLGFEGSLTRDVGGDARGQRVRTAGSSGRPRRGGDASSSRRPVSPLGRPLTAIVLSSPILWAMPESPCRRGLSPQHQSRDDATSMHRAVFSNLPIKPMMPHRIEPEEAITAIELLPLSEQSAGRKVLRAASNRATAALEWEGYTHNGKHSVPIMERARRAYLPKRSAAEQQPTANPANPTAPLIPVPAIENDAGAEDEKRDESALGRLLPLQPSKHAPQRTDRDDDDDAYTAVPAFTSYGSYSSGLDFSFDAPGLLQTFRPIYEFDLGADPTADSMGSMSVPEDGYDYGDSAAAAVGGGAVSGHMSDLGSAPPSDRRARHGLLTNADLLFSM